MGAGSRGIWEIINLKSGTFHSGRQTTFTKEWPVNRHGHLQFKPRVMRNVSKIPLM